MRIKHTKSILALVAICGLYSQASMATFGNQNHGCGQGSQNPSTCDTWAGAEIYDMYTNKSNIEEGTDASSGHIVVNGVTIKVSAWSDTAGNHDNIVESASIAGPWSSGSEVGYGIYNKDELQFDNHRDAHAIDNMGNSADYDMVLFSFSDAVSLTGATFSWLRSNYGQEVTVVGLDNISGLTNGSSTWSNIANSTAVVSKDAFTIEKCDDVYKSDFTTNATAKYWLLGAYNTAFVNKGYSTNDDAFKLATIGFIKDSSTSTKPPTDVDTPNSLALLMLGGGFIAWRNRKRKTH